MSEILRPLTTCHGACLHTYSPILSEDLPYDSRVGRGRAASPRILTDAFQKIALSYYSFSIPLPNHSAIMPLPIQLHAAAFALSPRAVFGGLVTTLANDTNLEFSTLSVVLRRPSGDDLTELLCRSTAEQDWTLLSTSPCSDGLYLWTQTAGASVSLSFVLCRVPSPVPTY